MEHSDGWISEEASFAFRNCVLRNGWTEYAIQTFADSPSVGLATNNA